MKRYLAGFLALTMMTLLVTSCGSKSSNVTSMTSSNTGNSPFWVSDTPVELTIHMHGFDSEWATMKKAQERTNVSLKGTVAKSVTDPEQVFSIMMASGNMPDIVNGDRKNFDKYAADGAFASLNTLIEKHAPNIKAFLEKNPRVKKEITNIDGNIYYLPHIMETEVSEGYFIRKDWLDKLGLPVPKTLDEYYNTLKAFRDKDPNGNGKQDEIPYFHRGNNVTQLLQLFGVNPSVWYIDKGVVKYAKAENSYKVAMSTLSKWYAEGLIDKELFTRGKARDVLLNDNLGGATHDWITSTSAYNDKIKDKVPGFNFVAIDPIADINGVVKEDMYRPLMESYAWGMSSNNKKQIETIKYFDFWMSDEGSILNSFGVEGTHYTKVDGKIKFTDMIMKGELPGPQMLTKLGIQQTFGSLALYSSEQQFQNEMAITAMDSYKKYITEPFPTLKFTKEQEKLLTKKKTAVETYIKEKENRWIMGTEKVDGNFDSYVKELKNLGLDEIIQIYNDAYKAYLKIR